MSDCDVTEPSKRRHVRQPPSVPFLWEERPGIANKDWKPVASTVTNTLALPLAVKLIASVPFNWEEKPGKPLSCFSQPSTELALTTTTPADLMSLPSPPMYSQSYYSGYEFNNTKIARDDHHFKREGIFDLDMELFSFGTDDSPSSAPSLLANCLVTSATVSAAVPVVESPSTNDISDQLETPSSPASDTESGTSSYATGISSLTGASFLECLFPLHAPNSSFLETAAHSNKGSLAPLELQNSNFDHHSDSIIMAKRTPTLGELIMMSRRRSLQRKAVQMRKQNLSMEFMNTKSLGGCIFGIGIAMIEGLQMKKRHARLKFI